MTSNSNNNLIGKTFQIEVNNMKNTVNFTITKKFNTNQSTWLIYESSSKILGDKILAKVIDKRYTWFNIKSIKNEIKLFKKASDAGISPKYYGSNSLDNQNDPNFIIFMEKWGDGSLADLFKKNQSLRNNVSIKKSVQKLIVDIYLAGIAHNDLHIHNILYKKTKNKIELKVIDFRGAQLIQNGNNKPKNKILPCGCCEKYNISVPNR